MKNWCKIIDLDEEHDCLVERTFDPDEDDKPVVKLTMNFGEGTVSVTLGFTTDKEADEAYAKVGKDEANKLIRNVFSTMLLP